MRLLRGPGSGTGRDGAPRRLAVGYLLLQALAVVVWWTALLTAPAVRRVFELGDPAVLDAFLPGDAVLAASAGTTAAPVVLARGSAAAPVRGGPTARTAPEGPA